ncbi:MAG: caspase family protein, partial [Candidatus Omnitrophica bacterium]|nr:caspase family protein [Candidatus Omnitrophota bacterium]
YNIYTANPGYYGDNVAWQAANQYIVENLENNGSAMFGVQTMAFTRAGDPANPSQYIPLSRVREYNGSDCSMYPQDKSFAKAMGFSYSENLAQMPREIETFWMSNSLVSEQELASNQWVMNPLRNMVQAGSLTALGNYVLGGEMEYGCCWEGVLTLVDRGVDGDVYANNRGNYYKAIGIGGFMITTVPVVNVEGLGWQEYISDANNNIFVQYAPASGAGSAIYAYYDQSTGRAVTDSADSFMRFYQVEGVGVVPVTVGLTGEGWVPLGSAQAEGEQVWVTPVQGGENIYERLEYDARAQTPWAGTGEYYRQDGQETWVKTTAPVTAVTLEERVFDCTKYTALSTKSEAGDSHIVRNDGIIDWIESGCEYWSNLIFGGDSKEESSKEPAPTGLSKYSPENVHVLMIVGDTAADPISQKEFFTNETAAIRFISQYEHYDYQGAVYLQLLTEIGVPGENIVVLSNDRVAGLPLPSIQEEYTEPVTEENFYAAVQTMMENVDENDLFVFVYLGHGTDYDDGNGAQYFMAASEDAIIPGETLAQLCDIVDSENTLVILENCFSGNLITDLSACERSDSLLVLTASGAGETSTTQGALASYSCEQNGDSLECSIKMGEFHTYSIDLLEALFSNEADTDGDGITSFEEAHTITAPEMTARFTDHPQIWDGNESCQIAIDLSRIDGSFSIGANADNDCAALAYAYLAAGNSGKEISEKEFFGLADNFKAASGMNEDGVSIEQMLKGFYSLGMNYKYEEVGSLKGLEAGAVVLTEEDGMLHAMVFAGSSGSLAAVYTCEEGWNNGGVELENIDPEELTIKGALIPAGTDASGLDRSREMTISVSSPGSIFYDNDSLYLYTETYFDAKGQVTGSTGRTFDDSAYFNGSVRGISHDGW